MNLLYISSKKRWGGVSSWMQRTAVGLEDLGNRVWVLAHPNGRFSQRSADGIRLIPKKLGMDYNPAMVYYLVRFIRRNHIDLIVTNIEKEVVIGGLAARLCRIPNIRRVGREDDFNQRLKVRYHHHWLVDACIVPCNYIRDRAIDIAPWLKPEQFTTIYNGRNPVSIDAAWRHKAKLKWRVGERQLVIGVTTQLSPQKRVDVLLDAFARVCPKHDAAVLVIAGEGKEKALLERRAASLGIAQRVRFIGFSTSPERTAAAYDIAVSPSSFEGFPNTVVEYFAAGCAVVTTSAGGVCEMAIDGVNALVTPVNDVDAMATAIATLIERPETRKKLGRNAAETIRERFSEDLMIEKLNRYYCAAIGVSRSGS
jgi:glycosyltransferase involved in cell wall biosynthesis